MIPSAEDIVKATQNLPKSIVCMDGRIRPTEVGRPIIGLAGSGVLLLEEEVWEFANKLKESGVDCANLTVTYHEHCGACEVYKKSHPQDKRETEQIAKWAAERLSKAIGSTKPVLKIGWSNECDLKANGDPHKHTEPSIIIDNTGKLDTSITNTDDSFLLSHAYAPNDSWMATELNIALSIAMGDHGPGKDYFFQNKMPVIIVDQAEKSIKKLHAVLDNYEDVIDIHKL